MTQQKKQATGSSLVAPMRTASFGTMPAAKPSAKPKAKKAKPTVINIEPQPTSSGEGVGAVAVVGLLIVGLLWLGD